MLLEKSYLRMTCRGKKDFYALYWSHPKKTLERREFLREESKLEELTTKSDEIESTNKQEFREWENNYEFFLLELR